MVPRIISVTDGVNLIQHNRISTGFVKAVVEEIADPSTVSVRIDSSPGKGLEVKCTDPVPPRYELNFSLPEALPPGRHTLRIQAGSRSLMPQAIEVCDPGSTRYNKEPNTRNPLAVKPRSSLVLPIVGVLPLLSPKPSTVKVHG